MQRRFRKVFTALREHTSVSYAKIATVGGFCNVEFIIIKATAPDDLPLPEKYIQELLKIFSISPSTLRELSLSFSRRFAKTCCWRVALKCLILLHRLLRAFPDDSLLRTELLWTRSVGLMSLHNCRFRDDSSSASSNYTVFVRTYAHLLDEALHCFLLDDKKANPPHEELLQLKYHDHESEEEEIQDEFDVDESKFQTLSSKMEEMSRMLEVLPQLQSLIDRVMECRPTGMRRKERGFTILFFGYLGDLINVGFFMCFASFLSLLTIMPTRILMTLWRLARTRRSSECLLQYTPLPWKLFWILLLFAMTYVMLTSLKVLIGMGLQKHASWYINRCKRKKHHLHYD